ncbi:hypothetical protein LUZ62_042266 [Rhynchospora pubera]|uniref:F-box domain-containing protein n=1 Tax=Rhynchospora pubera TaxID=906938 RepID=A0AAV8FFU5_9POAL|nr:hypothetical protein LUZ62_042266 [Rhynchospora pubera]
MDWSGLFPELLNAILGNLKERTDHLRFRCVCRSWRYTAKSHPMLPSLPWLYLPQDPTNSIDLRFYSLSEDRVYKIPLPQVRNSYISVSASGFLFIIGLPENPKLFLINPFTGRRAHLPYAAVHYFSCESVWDYSGSVFVGSYRYGRGVVYCQLRKNRWSRIKALSHCDVKDIIYKDGSFCILDSKTREVILLDGETLDITRIIQPPYFHYWHIDFAMSPDNDDIQLLVEVPDQKENDDGMQLADVLVQNGKSDYVLCNLNSQPEKSGWSKINNSGNIAIFDDQCRRVFVFETSRHSGLRKKTIIYPSLSNRHTNIGTWHIYAYNFENLGSDLKGQCSCWSHPFWILPRF